jgi:hypothetical protein
MKTWVTEVGVALLVLMALHTIWQRYELLTENSERETTASESPGVKAVVDLDAAVLPQLPLGFSVLPWAQ